MCLDMCLDHVPRHVPRPYAKTCLPSYVCCAALIHSIFCRALHLPIGDTEWSAGNGPHIAVSGGLGNGPHIAVSGGLGNGRHIAVSGGLGNGRHIPISALGPPMKPAYRPARLCVSPCVLVRIALRACACARAYVCVCMCACMSVRAHACL